MTSLRDRFKSCNTLVCLLQGMIGQTTTVELRNEDSVLGKIVKVDGIMNMDIENAVYKSVSGKESRFEQFYIQGKNIRFVHIPDGVNIRHTMTRQLKTISGVREGDKRPKIRGSDKDRKERRKKLMDKAVEKTRDLLQMEVSSSEDTG